MNQKVKRLRPRGGVMTEVKQKKESLRRKPWLITAILFLVILAIPACLQFFKVQAAVNPEVSQPPEVYGGQVDQISTPIPQTKAIEPTQTPEVLCPLPESIPGWSSKTSAKWYEVRQYCSTIIRYSTMYGVEAELVAATIMQESGGWAGAESSAGAQGPMQVMPFHYCASWDPIENIDCGTKILAGHVSADGMRAGLAAYNAGVTGRDVYKNGWDYADIVLAIYQKIKEAQTELP